MILEMMRFNLFVKCYFGCYLINISKMNTSSDNEQESQEVLLTSNTHIYTTNDISRVTGNR